MLSFHELWDAYCTYILKGFDYNHALSNKWLGSLSAHELLDEVAHYEKNVYHSLEE